MIWGCVLWIPLVFLPPRMDAMVNRNRFRRSNGAALFVACLALCFPGCDGGALPDGDAGRIRIVCTTGQVADLVENVGAEHVAVTALMGPGVDPHLYKATPGDRRALGGADLVFYNGLHLEGRLAELLEKLSGRRPAFVVVEEVEREHRELLIPVPGGQNVYDPHVWFDPEIWRRCTRFVADKLAEHDPEHAEEYRRNADAYVAKLDALERDCKGQIAEIPEKSRVLVTAHDAFGYFGRAYGLDVHGLQGISTADEADLGAVNDLIDLLVSRGVKAVFIESSVPPKNVQSLVDGCRARGHEVKIGGELFSDAMGPAGTPEGTYLGMVAHNVETIVEALK
jgi:manganese/zinc/iron transport system substrate-binding protein